MIRMMTTASAGAISAATTVPDAGVTIAVKVVITGMTTANATGKSGTALW